MNVSRYAGITAGIVLIAMCTGMCSCADAFDKRSVNALSHYIVASMLERRGDIAGSIKEYRKALTYDYANSAIHLGLGFAHLKQENTAQAIDEFNLAVTFDPDAVEPHAILALLYFSQSKITEAGNEYEAALHKAVVCEPRNSALYKSLGLVYLQKQDYAAAKQVYTMVTALSPSDAEAHFYLATIYDAWHDAPAVERELKTAIQLKEDYAEALNYLGYWYAEQDTNLAQAQALIKKAVLLEPDNGAYADSLGWVYFKQGKYPEAVATLEKAAAVLDDPVLFGHLGEAYSKMRNSRKAQEAWRKALTLDPANDAFRKKLEAAP